MCNTHGKFGKRCNQYRYMDMCVRKRMYISTYIRIYLYTPTCIYIFMFSNGYV